MKKFLVIATILTMLLGVPVYADDVIIDDPGEVVWDDPVPEEQTPAPAPVEEPKKETPTVSDATAATAANTSTGSSSATTNTNKTVKSSSTKKKASSSSGSSKSSNNSSSSNSNSSSSTNNSSTTNNSTTIDTTTTDGAAISETVPETGDTHSGIPYVVVMACVLGVVEVLTVRKVSKN